MTNPPKKYEIEDQEYSISELIEHPECINNYHTVFGRLRRGWDVYRAISEPAKKQSNCPHDKKKEDVAFFLGEPDLEALSAYQRRCLRKIEERKQAEKEYRQKAKKIMSVPVNPQKCMLTCGGGEKYMALLGIKGIEV